MPDGSSSYFSCSDPTADIIQASVTSREHSILIADILQASATLREHSILTADIIQASVTSREHSNLTADITQASVTSREHSNLLAYINHTSLHYLLEHSNLTADIILVLITSGNILTNNRYHRSFCNMGLNLIAKLTAVSKHGEQFNLITAIIALLIITRISSD